MKKLNTTKRCSSKLPNILNKIFFKKATKVYTKCLFLLSSNTEFIAQKMIEQIYQVTNFTADSKYMSEMKIEKIIDEIHWTTPDRK